MVLEGDARFAQVVEGRYALRRRVEDVLIDGLRGLLRAATRRPADLGGRTERAAAVLDVRHGVLFIGGRGIGVRA
jgi:hypothetical protein